MRRARRRCLLVFVAAIGIVPAAAARAQDEYFQVIDGPTVVQVGPPQAGQADSAAAAPGASGASRLQRLKQVAFDRRPSVILKAWSTPPGEATKPDASVPATPAPKEAAGPPSSEAEMKAAEDAAKKA